MDLKLSSGMLLLLMSTMNMLIYIDRGVIGSNGVNGSEATDKGPGSGIQGDFGINNAVDGFLPGAFMVGLLVSSPIFAECSKHYNAFRLIAVGLGIWAVACASCGLAPTFALLVVSRMFVGVGEASFVALAAPFIDDNAPPGAKTKWLAVFYLCIPTGYALGYIFGGLVAGPLGWRGPFLLEAAAMLPFVLFCCFAPPIDIRGTKEELEVSGGQGDAATKQHSDGAVKSFFRDIATLWRHPVYVFTVLGSTVYTGVIGAYSYLGPKAGRQVFDIPGETADLTFGVVTVLTGVLGTLLGGILLDYMGSGVTNALILCWACTFVGCLACAASFGLASSLPVFVGPFAFGELALFGIQAPSNAIILWAVPPSLRPFAMSMLIVVTHVFGDVPSPTALGWLQDHLQNWRLSMAICTFFLVLSSVFYGIAQIVSYKQPDYRQEAAAVTAAPEGETSEPLLHEAGEPEST